MADNFSQRAARGQAYNLAVSTAIADGKHKDLEYVFRQYLRHLKIADLLQNSSEKQLVELINNKELMAKLQGIQKDV